MLSTALRGVKRKREDLKTEATLTTLVHHDRHIRERMPGIDRVKTMAIELPPNDYYKKFDVITCQNSVYNWTKYPELATLNMWKMLRAEGGLVIGTSWKRAREIKGQTFNTIEFFESTPLFGFEYLGEANDGAAVAFKLTKKGQAGLS